MRLYDYVFHPNPRANGEWTVQGMDLESEDVERTQGPVITMTIEEAKELWDAAAWNGYENRIDQKTQGEVSPISPEFTAYLQSKNIKLP